jgi:steroid delta-isomerase-like uncharacterized protein
MRLAPNKERKITMSVQENIKLDEELNEAINAHDVERIMALLADDVVATNVAFPEPIRGKVAYGQFYQGSFDAFSDYTVVVKNRVVSEDRVATEIEFSGTHTGPLVLGPGNPIPPTGNKFAAQGAYFFRVREGKIAEIHMHPDIAGFLMQLGLLPAPGQGGS